MIADNKMKKNEDNWESLPIGSRCTWQETCMNHFSKYVSR